MIIFSNPGIIDIDAVTTLGVSVKENENPIGYFGTGLKYAIAVLLRNNHEIVIYAGEDFYSFETITKTIRSKDCNIVGMRKNGGDIQQLGFTTELGKNWQLWQAYRELYCNAKDEGGGVSVANKLTKSADTTTIAVTGIDFANIHKDRYNFILKPMTPIYVDENIEIYPNTGIAMFYRGIRVRELNTKPTRFTYNILKETKLTEDRTVVSEWDLDIFIAGAIIDSGRLEIIARAIENNDKYLESSLYWNYSYRCSPVFNEAVKQTRKSSRGVCHHAMELYHRNADKLTEVFNIVKLTKLQTKQWARAINMLAKVKLVSDLSDYEVVFVDNLGDNTYGQTYNGKIIINTSAFDRGTKILAGTIYEEYLHIHEKVGDFTRELQNHLIDRVMSLAEQVLQEPF